MTVKAKTKKEGGKFYGVVEFDTGNIQDSFFIGKNIGGFDTRKEAATAAKTRCQAMKRTDPTVRIL